MPTAIQPEALLDGQYTVPAEARTSHWQRVPQWLRERSFYMAAVTRAETLQEMNTIIRLAESGEAGEYELRQRWEAFLDRQNYQPAPGQQGTLHDLRSLRRFNVALRTNQSLIRGWAQRENGLRKGPLLSAPCWELIRLGAARVPRDWYDRWLRVGGTLPEGRLIAPKTDPIWERLGDIANFDDALGTNHPPFAWGSHMGWASVGLSESLELGVITKAQLRQLREQTPNPAQSPNQNLQTIPRLSEKAHRDALAKELGGLARWQGDTLILSDPNGTRPATQAQLIQLWAQALPEKFQDLPGEGHLQREVFLKWVEDNNNIKPTSPQADDLRRLIQRLINQKTPAKLHRGLTLKRQELDKILRLWRANGYTMKPGTIAESWSDSELAARRFARVIGKNSKGTSSKNRISITLELEGTESAKDISQLVNHHQRQINLQSASPLPTESEWLRATSRGLEIVSEAWKADDHLHLVLRAANPPVLNRENPASSRHDHDNHTESGYCAPCAAAMASSPQSASSAPSPPQFPAPSASSSQQKEDSHA